MRSASKLPGPLSVVLGQGFVAERIEFAGIRVAVQLLVPEGRIVGLKPFPKVSKLFRGETFYVLFDSLKFGHAVILLN